MLVSSTTPMGQYIEYDIAPTSRLNYIKLRTPNRIDSRELTRVFKRDIFVDSIIERISNVKLYYIEATHGRGDELYYFSSNNCLFHNEIIWSKYHPFLSHLQSISASAEVADPAWFVGSRSNYTHQMVDFLPNLIYRANKGVGHPWESSINIFGKTNKILESLSEIPILDRELKRPKLFLEELGHPVKCGAYQIRCINFRDMFLVRHLSIFKAFSLIQEVFDFTQLYSYTDKSSANRSLLYLSRSDNRVQNQKQIEDYLTSGFGATIIKDIHSYSYAQKREVLKTYDQIVMPPGSDNINALCFSNAECKLFQMIPSSVDKLLSSPFLSYAGLRYLLPFLHRLVLIPAEPVISQDELNSGKWALNNFNFAINQNQ